MLKKIFLTGVLCCISFHSFSQETEYKEYSYSDVTRILTYYKIIQENIGSGNYEVAEFHTNEMLKMTKLPEFYNIRGTLFYLKQDTTNAQKYWNLATSLTDSINQM